MHTNIANTSEQRQCHRCGQALPLTKKFFVADKSRPYGLAYECRACHSARKKGRDRRKERWSEMTPEQRAKKTALAQKYAKTPKGRSIFLLKAYQRIDKQKGVECDLDSAYIQKLFDSACVYCGTTEQIGCDRIDNTRGHSRDNVVPACGGCNVMRGNRFTYKEMLVIGKAVKRVRAARGKRPD